MKMTTIKRVSAEIAAKTALSQVLVHIETDDGTTGMGEAWWGIPTPESPGKSAIPIADVVEHLIGPRLVGKQSNLIEKHWFDLWDYGYRYADQGIFLMGLSGVDLALWDLLGKQLNIPVVQLLGGPIHESLPAYASLPPLREPDIVVSETRRAVDAGINAVKLHETEPRYVHILRDTFGDDLKIMVDVNGHFTPVEAREVGEELATRGITWFEEPVRPMRDHASIREVGLQTGLATAAGENEYTLDDFRRLLAAEAVTYLQPEITKIGGLTAAKRITGLTELYNTALCPHNFRTGPSLYASIHWAMASPMAAWMEIPWIRGEFASGIPLPPVSDGQVQLPAGNGLGLPSD